MSKIIEAVRETGGTGRMTPDYRVMESAGGTASPSPQGQGRSYRREERSAFRPVAWLHGNEPDELRIRVRETRVRSHQHGHPHPLQVPLQVSAPRLRGDLRGDDLELERERTPPRGQDPQHQLDPRP